MQVVATRDGYYGGRVRHAGDAFEVAAREQFSDRWMVEVGTAKHTDFVNAHSEHRPDRDKITGERISSGGVAEQLAVALEENRRLEGVVAELKAELANYRADEGTAPVAPVDPAGGHEVIDEQASAPTRHRRNTTDARPEVGKEDETAQPEMDKTDEKPPVRRRRQPAGAK
jgi:hypothetical protein